MKQLQEKVSSFDVEGISQMLDHERYLTEIANLEKVQISKLFCCCKIVAFENLRLTVTQKF